MNFVMIVLYWNICFELFVVLFVVFGVFVVFMVFFVLLFVYVVELVWFDCLLKIFVYDMYGNWCVDCKGW